MSDASIAIPRPGATLGMILFGLTDAVGVSTSPSGFHFVHVFAGPDGRSRIQTLDPHQASETLPYLFRARATSVAVLTFAAGHAWDWHLTRDIPRLIVQLRGQSAVIVDDERGVPGVSYFSMGPGAVMLAEDSSGRGHRGKVFPGEDLITLQIDLALDN